MLFLIISSSFPSRRCLLSLFRDLKPQNVLVTEGLRVKISDFGEARALDTDYTMTQVRKRCCHTILFYMSFNQGAGWYLRIGIIDESFFF